MHFGKEPHERFSLVSLVATLVLFATAVVSCAGDGPQAGEPDRNEIRENSMSTYVRLFGDYRHSSCISQSIRTVGEPAWFASLVDSSNAELPECILPTAEGCYVQFRNRIVALDSNGKERWESPRDSSMLAVVDDSVLYLRDAKGELFGLDAGGKAVMSDFEPLACYHACRLLLVYPKGEGRFLLHTANKSPEAEVIEERMEEPDDYNLVSQGPGGLMDSDYIIEFEGKSLPAMVSADGKRLVLLNYDHQVLSYDVATGRSTGKFQLKEVGFWLASLDNDGNIAIVLQTAAKEWKLVLYTPDGKLQWEYDLPAGVLPPNAQPPAIDSENRVLFVFGKQLLRVNNGELDYALDLERVEPIVRLTVQVDNSVLLASQNRVFWVSDKGSAEPIVELQPGEWLTAPPVVTDDGHLLIASVRGVYCF